MDDDSIRTVRAQPLFSGLDADVFGTLIQGVLPRTYPKGRVLFQRGDPADYFYIILDGWVKIYRDTAMGDHAVLGIFSRGDMFAEAAAFIGVGYPASAEIVEEARIVAIETKRFTAIVELNPAAALNMLASMSRHLHRLVYEVERLKTRSASQRLVEFLLRRCHVTVGPAVVDLPYDKNLIAARLGVQPESLSRLFNKLRDHGIETDANRVFVEDVARLREYCPVDEQEYERTVA